LLFRSSSESPSFKREPLVRRNRIGVVGACNDVDGCAVANQCSQRRRRHGKFFSRIAGLKSIAVSLEGPDELLETLRDFILHLVSDLDQNRGGFCSNSWLAPRKTSSS